MYNWIIDDNQNKQTLKFIINLPEIEDDREELGEVRVTSERFGDATWQDGTGMLRQNDPN